MREKYLPIGTVVLLEGATTKLMITGFAIVNTEQGNKVYDYCGCIYPYGVVNAEKINLFNHDQIKDIYHLGYENEEERAFKAQLINTNIEELLANINAN